MALESSNNRGLNVALSTALFVACSPELNTISTDHGTESANTSEVQASVRHNIEKLDLPPVSDLASANEAKPEIGSKQACIIDILRNDHLPKLLKDDWHNAEIGARSLRFSLPETPANDTLGIYFTGMEKDPVLSFWLREKGKKMKTFSDKHLDGEVDFGLMANEGKPASEKNPNEKVYFALVDGMLEGVEHKDFWQAENDRAVNLTLKHFNEYANSDACQALDWGEINKAQ